MLVSRNLLIKLCAAVLLLSTAPLARAEVWGELVGSSGSDIRHERRWSFMCGLVEKAERRGDGSFFFVLKHYTPYAQISHNERSKQDREGSRIRLRLRATDLQGTYLKTTADQFNRSRLGLANTVESYYESYIKYVSGKVDSSVPVCVTFKENSGEIYEIKGQTPTSHP